MEVLLGYSWKWLMGHLGEEEPYMRMAMSFKKLTK